jgi:predicted SAM-dependent methyltransferase
MSSIKLNIGCWEFKREGFVNIDIDPAYGEVVADASKLPYEDATVDEIFAGHILEHFGQHDDVLKEWHRVLKPGGLITIVVPDMEKGLDQFRIGTIQLDWLNQIVFGGQDREEQNHHQIFTEDILIRQMQQYFPDAEIIPAHRVRELIVADVAWQTIAQGHRP